MLFETFLYPYFKKDTLLAIGSSLLSDLFGYLSSCCQSIERKVNLLEPASTPTFEKIFSWNHIPGRDDASLISHLQRGYNLKRIEPYDIKKEDSPKFSTVKLSSASPIVIRLDKARNKVIMMSRTSNDEFQETEYGVHQVDGENVVSSRMQSEESTQDIVNDTEKRVEQLIYEFVYRLASSATEVNKEFSYYREILSQDEKFMKVVDEIYEKRHKGFEVAYKKLRSDN